MITYHNKDIFSDSNHIIVHGCNCFCTMGAGIAKTIKELYPSAYLAGGDWKKIEKIINDCSKDIEIKVYYL